MAQPAAMAGGFGGGISIRGGGKVVGDYIFAKQIGSGSFSVVWHARHRIRGTEVAVKEINMERLSKKLQDSLLSEIVILKKINHPNIIALLDIIEYPQRIYLVLEYCRGGDLSMYIQRHGRVPEATAKHFMQQLATGLQVLRQNNLIHRDLKPQNLLLSSVEDNSALKIADFGFARSLQPRVLAETLCGSPLYMAPEIMQLQKYDAKADLWSVGAILFQLVTGKTPFTGNNQIQLLQNIMKSNGLPFPSNNDLSPECIDLCQKLLRRNPVERLTFEEFFNHRFLSKCPPDLSVRSSRLLSKTSDSCPLVECSSISPPEEGSQEDCLPFLLDNGSIEPGGNAFSPVKKSSLPSTRQEGSQSVVMKSSSIRSTYGFSLGSNVDKVTACSPSNNVEITSRYSSTRKLENTGSKLDCSRQLVGNLREIKSSVDPGPMDVSSRDPAITDSLEFIDQDYVLVSGPPLEVSSSSVSASQPRNSPCKSESSPIASPINCALSAPIKITGAAISNTRGSGSLESLTSPPSGASQGSVEMGDAMEQPSTNCLTRIRSLQQCASVITELVNEKIEIGEQLEAFSIQLVVLAIWKQALHICLAQAASAIEGSPSLEVGARGDTKPQHAPNSEECLSSAQSELSDAIRSQIERDFLLEVEHAEVLARDLGQVDGAYSTEMPDAMEIIYNSARSLGRKGAADELMNNMESAATLYSKAVHLLYFLLVEAPSLILNPPFSLTNSDRNRLRSFIDKLNYRQSQSRSQRLTLLSFDDQQTP